MSLGILGGGISGIALQRFFKRPSEILESADKPGGLCRTFFKDGFGYDLGGHILFSKNETINTLVDELLGENINRCKRANKILFKDRLIKYPFENDLGALSKEDAYECLIGYLKNDYPKPTNLEEWCYHTFGKGIAEKYLLPYNQKIWNIPVNQQTMEWVERIPKPPMEDVLKSALGISTEGYLHQLFFRYPKQGGVEALVKALMPKEPQLICNFKIEKIRKTSSGWAVSNAHTTKHYEKIVVAFPIHEAVRCFENVPDEVLTAVQNLRYNTINVVFAAVNDRSLMDYSAIYIPDPSVVCHRVCYMGYFSEALVKPGTSSLIAEITTNPGDGIHELSDDAMVERTLNDLDRIQVLKKSNVIVTDIKRSRYGYPVYDLNYSRNVKIMRDYFKSIDVDLLGRFAEFEYINSDECLRRAIALANRYNA